MRGLIAKGMALPIPGKAAVGMVLAGGIYGVFFLLKMPQLGFMLGVAMAVVTFVLALFAFVMEKRDKKKAAEVEASIADSAASTPSGVNKVADRAKLDDLRRQFETGVQTFRDYGKNLYDMPWYAVVGEPGSGKTEAIRHSGIGFPPGLQDQLQGTGGTVNMNWWFTDQAVILDTAGRLMFEDVAPGDNNEWKEFLKLLRTNRPNCPINGMLLVIPADTLITDRADDIEKKAGKIAQQFDQIQRSLGVRFPVFVLITKADLINGFREFFDDITDPRLTAQMLGWSNPSDLDEPFRPEKVEEHLETVREHLLQRRFALLQDPVHTEDPKGRRIDQVDALYKFPEAITEISSRLRRYLEMIFVAGEWSQKPLFLRGIYFTSSMRDGDALDADLAEVLGVGVGALPEGKLWERERSYFLRDVFLDKVFKERGLVTRAANAGQVKRKRALVLAGTAALASLLLGGMIWYSYSQTKKQIQNPRDFWVAMKDIVTSVAYDEENEQEGLDPDEAVRRYLSPISESGGERELMLREPLEYSGRGVELDGSKQNYLELFDRAKRYYEENSSSSGLFALVASMPGGGSDVFKRQLPTQRTIFDHLVIARAAELARRDIIESGDQIGSWGAGEPGTGTLAGLLGFEIARESGSGGPNGDRFEDLVRFTIPAPVETDAGEGAASGDPVAEVRAYFEWLYSGDAPWPPPAVEAGAPSSIEAIDQGIASFNRYWRDPRGEGTLFGRLRALRDAGSALTAAEDRLAGISARLDLSKTESDHETLEAEWLAEHAAYESAFRAFDTAFVSVADEFNGEDFRNSNIADEARRAVWESAKSAYEALIDRFGDEDAVASLDEGKEGEARLLSWRAALVDARNAAQENYEQTARSLVDTIGEQVVPAHLEMRGGTRRYAQRRALYSDAREALARAVPQGTTLEEVLASIDDGLRQSLLGTNPDTAGAAGRAASMVLRAGARRSRLEAVSAELGRLENWRAILAQGGTPSLPIIPLTGIDSLDYRAELTPSNNLGLLASFGTIREIVGREADGGGVYVLDKNAVEQVIASIENDLQSHFAEYERFWTERVPTAAQIAPDPERTWGQMRRTLMSSEQTRAALRELRGLMAEALSFAAQSGTAAERSRTLLASLGEENSNDDLRTTVYSSMIPAWLGLSQEAGPAGEALRRAAESGLIVNRYFPIPLSRRVSGPEEAYWRSFAIEAVEKIAAASAGEEERAILAVEPDCQRFPITLDATPGTGLSHARVEEIQRVLAGVGVLTSTEDVVGAESPFLGIANDRVRGALDLINGGTLLRDPGRVTRLRDALRVASFLVDNRNQLTFTLAYRGFGLPRNQETDAMCEQLKIEGKRGIGADSDFTKFQGPEILVSNESSYRWRLPLAQPISMEFIPGESGPLTASIGDWGAIAALAEDRANPIDGQTVWPLPITLSNGRTFEMGAVFSEGESSRLDEMKRDWPRMNDWR